MSWATPFVSWLTDTVISVTAMDRIEENIRVLGLGGRAQVAHLTAANSLNIGTTDDKFIVDGATAIHFISTTGRIMGNVITLALTNAPDLVHHQGSVPANYAALECVVMESPSTCSTETINPAGAGYVVQFIYDGTYWRYIS
jgi:hypothetical protein